MAPDMQILEMFTTADDSMQGLWGLHRYVQAAHETANRGRIMERIPEGSFQMTHEWLRYYDRQELVIAVEDAFEFVHSRQSLVSLVAIFEAFLRRMLERLQQLGHVGNAADRYKKRQVAFRARARGKNRFKRYAPAASHHLRRCR